MFRIILPLLALVSCVSPTRQVASARDFDALPLCSRIKFAHASPRVSIDTLPKDFNAQAFREAKQIWTGAEMMARDTSQKCRAIVLRDLIERPASCGSDEWSGPYVDARALAPYEGMDADEFEAFRTCWR